MSRVVESSCWFKLLNSTRVLEFNFSIRLDTFSKKFQFNSTLFESSTQLDAIRNSDHLQARWARWASCSLCSLWSLLIQAIRANTSRLWLHNDYLIIALFNHLQESSNTKFSFKIFILKITFLSCFLIAQQKTLSCVAEIFLSVQVLSMLSCVLMNTAVACKRNVVLTTNLIIASSVCISIASAILLSWWWSEKE